MILECYSLRLKYHESTVNQTDEGTEYPSGIDVCCSSTKIDDGDMRLTAKSELLFVYGTLREGASHDMAHVLAKRACFVGEARVQGHLYDLGTYPGLVSSDDSTDIVIGELYGVPRDQWGEVIALLDDYEGCGPKDREPHEYRRSIISVTSSEGATHRAWTYLLARPLDGLDLIPEGDYLKRKNRRVSRLGC